MILPALMEQLAFEGFSIIQIDLFRQGSPVQEAIAEGYLDMVAVFG